MNPIPPAATSESPCANEVLRASFLTCEYLTNPHGIAELQPRLGWIVEPGARGQTAFHVLVASGEELLKVEAGDLWDSGKVKSHQSIHVSYAGVALKSRQECFWKVRVWDKDGRRSEWSRPARWSMGLLHPSDWQGKWIGKDEEDNSMALQGTDWIWFPEADPGAVIRYFRRAFDLPGERVIQSAKILVAADSFAGIFVNGKKIGHATSAKATIEFDVTAHLRSGGNVLAVSVENLGGIPKPAGLLVLLTMEFNKGEPLMLATDESWISAREKSSGWEQPGFDDADWVPAKNLGPVGIAPWGKTTGPEDPARKTAPAIIATSYFYHCLKLMSGYAALLDKPADAARFAALGAELKAAQSK